MTINEELMNLLSPIADHGRVIVSRLQGTKGFGCKLHIPFDPEIESNPVSLNFYGTDEHCLSQCKAFIVMCQNPMITVKRGIIQS